MMKTGRHRLLFQTALIIIPFFALMTAAVAWTVYISSVNSYLKAQETQIRDIMNDNMFALGMTEDELMGSEDEIKEWMIRQYSEVPFSGSLEMTDEERDEYIEYHNNDVGGDQYNFYINMPDKIKVYLMKNQ